METLENSDTNPIDSPNKRQKIETLASQPPITPSSNKGKSPIIAGESDDDDDDDDCELPPENCGICMSMEGESVRGCIDSCDHYFCLICIIQWSKIESRCPLCRGRFTTIRRVRKDGTFIGQGCVRVPVRDQIYDPFGEPVDPYAEAKCSVCNGTKDESLLLLCDLCDSASHTYCVGLGATVPEDDWYCRDCALLRAEQLGSETGDDEDQEGNLTTLEQVDEELSISDSAAVSIFDIVRDPNEDRKHDRGTDRLLKLVSHPTKFSSSAVVSDQPNTESARSVPGSRSIVRRSMEVTESNARTLHNCRNVQRHINVLRENWNSVRTGSLSFSFVLSNSYGKGSHDKNAVGTSPTTSGKSQSFLSTNTSLSNAAGCSNGTSCNNEPYNVDRAWKLMTIAKTKPNTKNLKSTSKIARNKAPSIQKDKFISNFVPRRNDLTYHGGLGKLTVQVSKGSAHSGGILGRQSQESCFPKLSLPRVRQTHLKANSHHNGEFATSSRKLQGRYPATLGDSSALSEYSCGRRVEAVSSFHDKTLLPSDNNLGGGICSMPDKKNAFLGSTSSCEPVGCGLDADIDKLEGKKTSMCGKVETKITSKGSKDDDAKAEILSLVKLNLKLLSKDKRLGVDAFKEIARLSTHTILASCGFEHRKIVRSLPALVCHHSDEILHLRRSAFMPSSCRECFYAFVKDVVSSIMFEKLNCASVAS